MAHSQTAPEQTPEAAATSQDVFVEPTDWSTVPEPYADPPQDQTEPPDEVDD